MKVLVDEALEMQSRLVDASEMLDHLDDLYLARLNLSLAESSECNTTRGD
jgi:hypothetical protein